MPRRDHEPLAAFDDPTPRVPSPLPPQLATILRTQADYVLLAHGTDRGTVYVVKAPASDIAGLRGRIPISVRHELYEHPLSPVIRTVLRLYDRPQTPLALECYCNAGEPDQREEFAALGRQGELLLLCYDARELRHRLSKRVRNAGKDAIAGIVARADALLARIPRERRDFDRAKTDVLRRTTL